MLGEYTPSIHFYDLASSTTHHGEMKSKEQRRMTIFQKVEGDVATRTTEFEAKADPCEPSTQNLETRHAGTVATLPAAITGPRKV